MNRETRRLIQKTMDTQRELTQSGLSRRNLLKLGVLSAGTGMLLPIKGLSLRPAMAGWNLLFHDATPFQADPARSAEWNRGAYLVQGLGHCGACHTPRGVGFQEKTMTGEGRKGEYFLAGETVEGWRALSLRNLWTPEETAELLKPLGWSF